MNILTVKFPASVPCFHLVLVPVFGGSKVKKPLSSAMKQKYFTDYYKKATLSSLCSSGYHESGRAWGQEARDLSSLQYFLDVMKFAVRDLET